MYILNISEELNSCHNTGEPLTANLPLTCVLNNINLWLLSLLTPSIFYYMCLYCVLTSEITWWYVLKQLQHTFHALIWYIHPFSLLQESMLTMMVANQELYYTENCKFFKHVNIVQMPLIRSHLKCQERWWFQSWQYFTMTKPAKLYSKSLVSIWYWFC